MFLCLRVDLDYVPWDSPDATEFGHGEPAVLLKLLELGRFTGYKFHFFASNLECRAGTTGHGRGRAERRPRSGLALQTSREGR